MCPLRSEAAFKPEQRKARLLQHGSGYSIEVYDLYMRLIPQSVIQNKNRMVGNHAKPIYYLNHCHVLLRNTYNSDNYR